MYPIQVKKNIAESTYLMKVYAPRIAKSALPGHFLIIKMRQESERIPLTIADTDPIKGTVTIVVKAIGRSTIEMGTYQEGDSFADVVGPLGNEASFIQWSASEIHRKRILFIAGGVGIAPVYPQAKWLYYAGASVDVVIGARTKSMLFFQDELKEVCDNLYVTTDDNSCKTSGLVTDMLVRLLEEKKVYDEIITIGPLIMMKLVTEVAQKYGIKCTVSLNSMMVDGTGMCGACRVTVGGKTRFTCVNGPEFDGSMIDFDEAMKRQAMYSTVEGKKQIEASEKQENHQCHIGGIVEDKPDKKRAVPLRERRVEERITNFEEVCFGYNAEEAIIEAQRCLQCKKPMCIEGCPVAINIPSFIASVAAGNFKEAAQIINKDSALPAVCGRVCPQEIQCEGLCILGKKHDPIAIGKLERFVGDWSRENELSFDAPKTKNNQKVAIVGSGPAGITCAKELLLLGYEVTVFEALHEYGGVLVYGIPSFRLPKNVVKYEVAQLLKLGAHFEKNVVVGKTISMDQLINEEGYKAVFLGTGAGLPKFMNIPGENLNGVVSANEFLTRNNLLFAYKKNYRTPNYVGKKVVVVGGGNVAMDAARTALRLGAQVEIVYRRSIDELPARKEEVHHAQEEGITFNLLCNPTEIIGDEEGWVKAMTCIRMTLGEPDSTGRRKPVELPDSQFTMETDMVIMAIGTSPNPLIANTTPGLELNKWNCIVADEETGQTTRPGVFAGGDAVSGAATVILAMGAGKKAAIAIDRFIRQTNQ